MKKDNIRPKAATIAQYAMLLVLCFLALVALVSCSNRSKTNLSVTDYYLSKDSSDSNVLVIEYDFYNGSKKDISFQNAFEDRCFQNGFRCGTDVFGVPEVSNDKINHEVRAGTTAHLAVAYRITDFSQVTLLVSEKSGEKTYVNMTITINNTAESSNQSESTTSTFKDTTPKTTEAVATTEVVTEAPTEATENTYEHNEYYDIVESSSYSNIIGYTVVIDKVLAKKDAEISSNIIAYDTSGNVIGKETDRIALTAGCYNYFMYTFESDISSASFTKSYSLYNSYTLNGDKNAVELATYNYAGTSLYLTFNQVGEISYFSKFKLLFYKNDTIVYADDGYFSTYTENLTGAGSTDVADFWLYNVDFDRLEYIYEP